MNLKKRIESYSLACQCRPTPAGLESQKEDWKSTPQVLAFIDDGEMNLNLKKRIESIVVDLYLDPIGFGHVLLESQKEDWKATVIPRTSPGSAKVESQKEDWKNIEIADAATRPLTRNLKKRIERYAKIISFLSERNVYKNLKKRIESVTKHKRTDNGAR